MVYVSNQILLSGQKWIKNKKINNTKLYGPVGSILNKPHPSQFIVQSTQACLLIIYNPMGHLDFISKYAQEKPY